MLDRIGRDAWQVVARYCGIESIFAARCVARALCATLSPAVAPRVWAAVQPPRWALNRQLASESAMLQTLELLRALYGYSSEDLRGRADAATPLHIACARGATDCVVWLLQYGEFSAHYALCDDYNPFVIACMNGHLAIARLLAAHFNIEPSQVELGLTRVLQLVCERRHLPVAMWLVEHFGFDVRHVRAALMAACQIGALDIVQWLDARFEFTVSDLGPLSPYDTDTRFTDACSSGNLELVQWLVTRFELTAKDATFSNAKALRLSCARGHLTVARWLVAHFRMDVHSVRNSRELINIARGYQFNEVACWLEAELAK